MNIIKRVKEWLCGIATTTTTTQQPESTSFDILLEELFVKHPMFVVGKESGVISTTQDWEIVKLTGKTRIGSSIKWVEYCLTLKHIKTGLQLECSKGGNTPMSYDLRRYFYNNEQLGKDLDIPQYYHWHPLAVLSGKSQAPYNIDCLTLKITPDITYDKKEKEKLIQVLSEVFGETATLSCSILEALKEKEQEAVNKRRAEESIKKKQLAHKQIVCENVRELLEKLNKEEE